MSLRPALVDPQGGPITGKRGGPMLLAKPAGTWSHVAGKRQWAAGGPDVLSNGVCLCSLHHKLFDRGVLGLDTDHLILVSDRFRGTSSFAQQMVWGLAGQSLRPPQPGREHVHVDHIAWHRKEVFRGDPRGSAA